MPPAEGLPATDHGADAGPPGRVPERQLALVGMTGAVCFGLYFGTSTGQIFASLDEGDSWTEVSDYLPSIQSVRVATLA